MLGTIDPPKLDASPSIGAKRTASSKNDLEARWNTLDRVLLGYVLPEQGEDGAPAAPLAQKPSPLGAEVIGIVLCRLSDHPTVFIKTDVDRVRAALIEEFRRADRRRMVNLDHLADYIHAVCTSGEARPCLLDIAWALRDGGFETGLGLPKPAVRWTDIPKALRAEVDAWPLWSKLTFSSGALALVGALAWELFDLL